MSDDHASLDEAEFLEQYRLDDYERPSVAADVVTFAIRAESEESYRKNPKQHLSLLLIRRGVHPFCDAWALPGGFLQPTETIEQCAARELQEETGVAPTALRSVGVFSQPDRDPRGRILSVAFLSILTEENVRIMAGNDAAAAQWFDVTFVETDTDAALTLRHDDTVLSAKLRKISGCSAAGAYEIAENDGLAFDHAAIIASAIAKLRRYGKNLEMVFDFLPEKFTLTQLQMVQETITDIAMVPANFRRKIAAEVQETNEFVTGAGHRPAKLFIRKKEELI